MPRTSPADSASGPRLRAFAIGLPLLIGICMLSVYADMVSKVVQFGVLQLAPPAVAALFALALLNRALAKLLRRAWLSATDLLAIYLMLLVGVMVSTRGVIEKLIPPLVYLPYYATRENNFNRLVTCHLPAWAVPFVPTASSAPASPAIRAYFEKLSPGQPLPWSIWIGPICAWFVLIACVMWTFLCLATLLRRQWMDNEQLRFPLTALPLAVIRDKTEGRPFFSNRLMWLGFALPVLVFGINGLAANFPDWPRVVVGFDPSPYLSNRPWNAMDSSMAYISLAAIGFMYLLPVDLLFSLWFFFLLTRFQDVAAVSLGGLPQSIGTHNARVFTGYQAAGAYLVLVFAQLRIGWPYFKQVWQTAFTRHKPLDDSAEMMSYRAALIGIFVGFGGIVLWLALAGMNPIVAAAQMGLYIFFIALIMSRAVIEAGVLMTETSFLPSHLIALVYPLPQLGPVNIAMLGMTNVVFTRDLRGVLLSPFLDGQKMAKELGIRMRALLLPIVFAFLVAFVVASIFFIHLNYRLGGLTLYAYPNNNAANMFRRAAGDVSGATPPPGATEYGGLLLGIGVTLALVWARTTFTWFPLHPLAYAIAPTWMMICFWFPALVAWIIKRNVLRFGGIETYRRLIPFMLGMVLGEFMSAMFWSAMNMCLHWSVPDFPWP